MRVDGAEAVETTTSRPCPALPAAFVSPLLCAVADRAQALPAPLTARPGAPQIPDGPEDREERGIVPERLVAFGFERGVLLEPEVLEHVIEVVYQREELRVRGDAVRTAEAAARSQAFVDPVHRKSTCPPGP